MVKAEIVKADERRLTKAFAQLSNLTGKPVHDLLKQHGRLLAVDAATYTDRKGKSATRGADQKKDVRSTILSTYMRPLAVAKVISTKAGLRVGKKFSNYIRTRNIGKAQELLNRVSPLIDGGKVTIGTFDNGKLHKQRLKGQGGGRLCVVDYRSVQQYLKAELLKVGELKSGWARAAEMLGGTRGIPAYAKKPHHKTKGRGKVTGQNSKAVLEVSNFSPAMKYTPSLDGVWRTRINSIEKTIRDTIARRSKKTKRKYKV